MAETMQYFKKNVSEPWEIVLGFGPYLDPARKELLLDKATYFPYAVVENDVFPATNLNFAPIRENLNKSEEYPELKGMMGNNQMLLLQFPSNYFFFTSLWDSTYRRLRQEEILMDVASQLYPEHKSLVASSFLALREKDPDKIRQVSAELGKLIASGNAARPGVLGRQLFPDHFIALRDLQDQLSIRLARQTLINELSGGTDVATSRGLVEDYFDRLLAWNKKTGWEKMMDEGSTTPIYHSALLRECGCQDLELGAAMSRLKQIIGQGKPNTSYAQIENFFSDIANNLLKKYSQDSVMVGCVEPFKLAVIQTP
jgi:hypothetical protein